MGVWIETIIWLFCRHPGMSHPVWVCGLKHSHVDDGDEVFDVTPCMGVWIETLARERTKNRLNVTPCMGVWIETSLPPTRGSDPEVTPCMGVWIETIL